MASANLMVELGLVSSDEEDDESDDESDDENGGNKASSDRSTRNYEMENVDKQHGSLISGSKEVGKDSGNPHFSREKVAAPLNKRNSDVEILEVICKKHRRQEEPELIEIIRPNHLPLAVDATPERFKVSSRVRFTKSHKEGSTKSTPKSVSAHTKMGHLSQKKEATEKAKSTTQSYPNTPPAKKTPPYETSIPKEAKKRDFKLVAPHDPVILNSSPYDPKIKSFQKSNPTLNHSKNENATNTSIENATLPPTESEPLRKSPETKRSRDEKENPPRKTRKQVKQNGNGTLSTQYEDDLIKEIKDFIRNNHRLPLNQYPIARWSKQFGRPLDEIDNLIKIHQAFSENNPQKIPNATKAKNKNAPPFIPNDVTSSACVSAALTYDSSIVETSQPDSISPCTSNPASDSPKSSEPDLSNTPSSNPTSARTRKESSSANISLTYCTKENSNPSLLKPNSNSTDTTDLDNCSPKKKEVIDMESDISIIPGQRPFQVFTPPLSSAHPSSNSLLIHVEEPPMQISLKAPELCDPQTLTKHLTPTDKFLEKTLLAPHNSPPIVSEDSNVASIASGTTNQTDVPISHPNNHTDSHSLPSTNTSTNALPNPVQCVPLIVNETPTLPAPIETKELPVFPALLQMQSFPIEEDKSSSVHVINLPNNLQTPNIPPQQIVMNSPAVDIPDSTPKILEIHEKPPPPKKYCIDSSPVDIKLLSYLELQTPQKSPKSEYIRQTNFNSPHSIEAPSSQVSDYNLKNSHHHSNHHTMKSQLDYSIEEMILCANLNPSNEKENTVIRSLREFSEFKDLEYAIRDNITREEFVKYVGISVFSRIKRTFDEYIYQ